MSWGIPWQDRDCDLNPKSWQIFIEKIFLWWSVKSSSFTQILCFFTEMPQARGVRGHFYEWMRCETWNQGGLQRLSDPWLEPWPGYGWKKSRDGVHEFTSQPAASLWVLTHNAALQQSFLVFKDSQKEILWFFLVKKVGTVSVETMASKMETKNERILTIRLISSS